MPKRTDISSILVIGAGPIVIGQACEFDYSGTQAIKALKEEGYRVVLVNSNPATIMTDPELADATYVEPITPEIVAKIIEKERPDAVLPTMGGQTALNTALALFNDGTLEKYGVQMIGADAEAIDKAEDRLKFREAMDKIGLESARSGIAHTRRRGARGARAHRAAVDHPPELHARRHRRRHRLQPRRVRGDRPQRARRLADHRSADRGIAARLEGVSRWRSCATARTTAIIICSIENVDPMGVHTGDSITVAPALTLTDKEYQIMRNASIAVLREIGVETGGSNVQFAVNPKDGRLIVIEMNPRVSRSSALASKATGFPIAQASRPSWRSATRSTRSPTTSPAPRPASFEPTIDYVVTKIPRFAFEKFKGAEAAAVDRDEVGRRSHGDRPQHQGKPAEGAARARDRARRASTASIELEGRRARRDRRRARRSRRPTGCSIAAQAFREGFTVEEIQAHHALRPVVPAAHRGDRRSEEAMIAQNGLPQRCRRAAAAEGDGLFRQAPRHAGGALGRRRRRAGRDRRRKRSGLLHDALEAMAGGDQRGRSARSCASKLGVLPVFKRIDTCAAEFEAKTPYMYSTYEAPSFGEPENEADADRPAQDRHPRRRAEPDRAGDRVRLLLLSTPASRWARRATRRS